MELSCFSPKSFAEPNERNLSADGHDTAISRALRSIQESHGSDLRGAHHGLRGSYLFHDVTFTTRSIGGFTDPANIYCIIIPATISPFPAYCITCVNFITTKIFITYHLNNNNFSQDNLRVK